MKKIEPTVRKNWLHITDAARFIGVSQDTLRRWERKGKLIPRRTVGGHRRYSRKQLERILNQPMRQAIKKETNITKDIPTQHYASPTTPVVTHQPQVKQEIKSITISDNQNNPLSFIKNNIVYLGITLLIFILLLASYFLLTLSKSSNSRRNVNSSSLI